MDTFRRYLCRLQGTFVQIERTGPDACEGWLASVQDDYVTLRAEDGEDLHLPLRHIRNVCPADPPHPAPDLSLSRPPGSFGQLLAQNLGRLVRLFHAGPEVTVGTLREVGKNHVILELSPDEVICFALFHVRSLYLPADGATMPPLDPQEPARGGNSLWKPG